MNELSNRHCEACNKLTLRIPQTQSKRMVRKLNGWRVLAGENGYYLGKLWSFKNFADPLKLVLAISNLAEAEGHHPDINFGWGYLEVRIQTHVIKDLSINDFILAAKIDDLKI